MHTNKDMPGSADRMTAARANDHQRAEIWAILAEAGLPSGHDTSWFLDRLAQPREVRA